MMRVRVTNPGELVNFNNHLVTQFGLKTLSTHPDSLLCLHQKSVRVKVGLLTTLIAAGHNIPGNGPQCLTGWVRIIFLPAAQGHVTMRLELLVNPRIIPATQLNYLGMTASSYAKGWHGPWKERPHKGVM